MKNYTVLLDEIVSYGSIPNEPSEIVPILIVISIVVAIAIIATIIAVKRNKSK